MDFNWLPSQKLILKNVYNQNLNEKEFKNESKIFITNKGLLNKYNNYKW